MKTEIKIALIGGGVTILAAILPIILGWYGPSSAEKQKVITMPVVQSSPSVQLDRGQVNGVSGEKNKSSSAGSQLDRASAATKFAALAEIIRNRDLQAAKASPLVKKFVEERYGKQIEQLDRRQMLRFWPELSKYLVEQQRAEKR
ncbi:MAG: hypothetical protein FDX02_05515 [Chlorobium sp.]|nr:MAG: hypothetical protein FDX02_05515 [Chlorobium sp.]